MRSGSAPSRPLTDAEFQEGVLEVVTQMQVTLAHLERALRARQALAPSLRVIEGGRSDG